MMSLEEIKRANEDPEAHAKHRDGQPKGPNTYLNGEAELREWQRKNPGKPVD